MIDAWQFHQEVGVNQHVVPVANCNTIELLKFAVQIAEQQQNPIIFKSEVLAAVTDLHWSTSGKKGHDTKTRELKHDGFAQWANDIWNIMDVASFGMIYNGIGLQIAVVVKRAAPTDAVYKAANIINALTALLLWMKLLHYMRPYPTTGPLVTMIFKILVKIRPFMLVLTVVVLGFATAFYAVLDEVQKSAVINSDYKYNTVSTALRTSFAYLLGDYELSVLDAGPSRVMTNDPDKWSDRVTTITNTVTAAVKSDIAAVRHDNDRLKAEIIAMQASMNNVNENMAELKGELVGLKTSVKAITDIASTLLQRLPPTIQE
eukprot:7061-Heterococcus_DN1.PRE.1